MQFREVSMIKKLLQTDGDVSSLVLRLFLGVVFFPHGMQKVFGWFGGHGFQSTMGMFTEKMGVPAVLAFLAILAESGGAIALISGFLTRVAAFGIACNMLVAISMVHFHNGFFMNWSGKQQGEGFEYHLLVIAIAMALMIKGGGRWSVDRIISGRG